MVVLGGLGSITGAVARGDRAHPAARGAARAFAGTYRMVRLRARSSSSLMLLRPQGIFGTRELIWCRAAARRSPRRLAGARRREDARPMSDRRRVRSRSRTSPCAFGGLKALTEFDLDDAAGRAGRASSARTAPARPPRSTLLTGVYPPHRGRRARRAASASNGRRPHQIARRGVARTFQNIRLFKELTALDNVRIACHARRAQPASATRCSCAPPRYRAEEARHRSPAPSELPRA